MVGRPLPWAPIFRRARRGAQAPDCPPYRLRVLVGRVTPVRAVSFLEPSFCCFRIREHVPKLQRGTMRGRFGAARHGLRFAPSQSIKRDTTREIGNSSLLTVPQVDSYSSRFKCQPPRIASVPLFRKISKIQSGKSRNKLRCSSEYPPFSL